MYSGIHAIKIFIYLYDFRIHAINNIIYPTDSGIHAINNIITNSDFRISAIWNLLKVNILKYNLSILITIPLSDYQIIIHPYFFTILYSKRALKTAGCHCKIITGIENRIYFNKYLK